MSVNQFSKLFITAVIVIVVLTVTAVSVTHTAITQNMTGQYTGPDFEPPFKREGEIPFGNPDPREPPCNPGHPDCLP